MADDALFRSKDTEWGTPQYLFSWLDSYCGFHFDLDPCSTDENAKGKYHYTEKDDGLKRIWFGKVYLNPPYSHVKAWLDKMLIELCAWHIECAVVLVPARTDTSWWHKYAFLANEWWFLKGKLKFVGAESPAPFSSVLLIYRELNQDELPRPKSVDLSWICKIYENREGIECDPDIGWE